ncbi:hypothetical protein J6590_002211 [Homalodisca vitripennis]|nr:hypothetical protein J6590_002211 [Homalodisca vitripennis]
MKDAFLPDGFRCYLADGGYSRPRVPPATGHGWGRRSCSIRSTLITLIRYADKWLMTRQI